MKWLGVVSFLLAASTSLAAEQPAAAQPAAVSYGDRRTTGAARLGARDGNTTANLERRLKVRAEEYKAAGVSEDKLQKLLELEKALTTASYDRNTTRVKELREKQQELLTPEERQKQKAYNDERRKRMLELRRGQGAQGSVTTGTTTATWKSEPAATK